jgi:hypothetical protein
MAGVSELLMRPRKKIVAHRTSRADMKLLELETAEEILAEVFGVGVSDVEEMIKNHFEAQFEEAHHERDSYGRLSSDRKNCIFGLCGVSAFHRKTHSVVGDLHFRAAKSLVV